MKVEVRYLLNEACENGVEKRPSDDVRDYCDEVTYWETQPIADRIKIIMKGVKRPLPSHIKVCGVYEEDSHSL